MGSHYITIGSVTLQTQGVIAALGVVIGIHLSFFHTRVAYEQGRKLLGSVAGSIVLAFVIGKLIGLIIATMAPSGGQTAMPEMVFLSSIVAGLAALYIFSMVFSFDFFLVLDLLVKGALIALGAFFVSAWVTGSMSGRETILPWGIEGFVESAKGKKRQLFHPIALYYALLIGFAAVYIYGIRSATFFNGQRFGRLLIILSLGVFVLEFFNQSSQNGNWQLLSIPLSATQVTAGFIFATGTAIYYFVRNRAYEKL